MEWLLLLMLVSLITGEVYQDTSKSIFKGFCTRAWPISIEKGSQKFHDCEWKIQFPSDSDPKFIAHFDIFEGECQLECNYATSWSEFEYQSTVSLFSQRGTLLRIKRCPLPDESFEHIIKRLRLESVKYLMFTSHMNLGSTLTRRHLSMLSELRVLNLSSNGLTELPSDLFREVGTVEQLDLSFNEIALLPGDIFYGLSELKTMNLRHNAIESVDWRTFSKCTELTELSLNGNLLTRLDSRTFRKMNWIHAINLAENLPETSTSAAFESAKRLVLDISGNRFSMLPEELFRQTKLAELTFSHNQGNLTTLPMNFLANLPSLEKVVFTRNKLTSLPENIFWDSHSVCSIDLHGNALSTLPENIFRDSRALTSLDLSDNGLTNLPEGLFRALSRLQRLDLSRNGIASLPEHIFGNLDSLLALNLEMNNITNIPGRMFRRLPSIRLIQLSHNSIEHADPDILRLGKYFGGRTIRAILLDHNNLKGSFSIEPLDGDSPTDLWRVDLTHNQISYVQVSSPLIGSHDVEYDLSHNNLSTINITCEIFSKINILVDDNPLYCGCMIYDSLEYMHKIKEPQSGENVEIIVGNASCSEPSGMKGTPVASLQLETFTCHPEDFNLQVRCTEGCDCLLRPDDRTRIVNCSSKNIGKMPDEIIVFTREDDGQEQSMLNACVKRQNRCSNWGNTPVELDLTNNSLTKIPPLNIFSYKYVRALILSRNNISKLTFDVLPPKLKTLHLAHNHLERFDRVALNAIIRSATLRKLNLEGNPWSCDSKARQELDSMENKLGANLQYSTMNCLDYRNRPSIKKTGTLYISYTIF